MPTSRLRARRRVLTATILGSTMAFLDGTVVNVALPVLQQKLHAPFGRVQWVVESYLLFLSAFILVGGSLGDRFGRRKVFVTGTAVFALASAACGAAPSIEILVAARALQGVGAALLVPGSLALITAAFPGEARGTAIGTWSGATALTTALGPLVGGLLVQHVSWRSVFFLNVPIGAAVIVISLGGVPESRQPSRGPIDYGGAVLAAIGLGTLVFGLTEASRGAFGGAVAIPLAAGAGATAAFVLREARIDHAMLPLDLFRSRVFSAANGYTLFLYAGLGATLYFVPFELIQARGYSPAQAGASLLPFVAVVSALSRSTGRLGERIGPRLPLAAGALLVTAGLALFLLLPATGTYAESVLVPVTTLGLGMALAVPPLTATVMGSESPQRAGIVSAFNNAVSRIGGLFAIAALTIAVSATPGAFSAPGSRAFRVAMSGSAAMALAAVVIAGLALPGRAGAARRR